MSTPALCRLVANECRHHVPDGQMDLSQCSASWQILITRSFTFEFSCMVYLRRNSSVSAPFNICGKTKPPRVGGAATSSNTYCKGGMIGTITSEPSALLREVFLSVETEGLAVRLVIVVIISQSPCISHIETIA